jgi:uncharacterized damage-inducible protein DinB
MPSLDPPPIAPPAHALTFRELLDYTAAETAHWHRWLAAGRGGLLDLPAGEGRTATVRGLLHHVFVVERRYADRLLGDPVTPYEAVDTRDVATLFAAGAEARRRLERYLAGATAADLARRLEFQTLSAGTLHASARKIVAHVLVHGIRHWAQLATVLRQHGEPTDWMHDLLMSDTMA